MQMSAPFQSNPFYDSYQQGPRGSFHTSQYQPNHNAQYQQQMNSTSMQQQHQHGQQQYPHQQLPNQQGDIFEDSMMDYVTRQRDNTDGGDPSSFRKHFPGNP